MSGKNVKVQKRRNPKVSESPLFPTVLPRPDEKAAGDRHSFLLCNYVPIAHVPTAPFIYSDISPRSPNAAASINHLSPQQCLDTRATMDGMPVKVPPMSLFEMIGRMSCLLVPLLLNLRSLDRPLRGSGELRMSDTLGRIPYIRISNVMVVRKGIDNPRRTAEEFWRWAIDLDRFRNTHRIQARAILICAPVSVAVVACFVLTERVRCANRAVAAPACAQNGDSVAGNVANVHAGGLVIRGPVALDPRAAIIGFAIAYLEISANLAALLAEGAGSTNRDVGALAGYPRETG